MTINRALLKPLYQAAFAALSDVTVDDVPIDVAEDHRPNAAHPYVTYTVSVDASGEHRGEGELVVTVWSNRGAKSILIILAACAQALDRVALMQAEAGNVVCLPGPTPPISRNGDGTTRSGAQIFRLLVQKT